MLAASRVLVGVAARSLAAVEDTVTLTQVRALVIIASRGPLHLTALAEDMGVHPSNATRACDRLVAAGLLDRRDNPADRRHLLLDPDRCGPGIGRRCDGSPAGGDRANPARDACPPTAPSWPRCSPGSLRPAENPRTPTCGRSAGSPSPPADNRFRPG